ncbi:MAG: bifunctional phosphopantothenoylcysteine decarboxylase/phosphopantothenate--cysteine ligase CoaBC [Micropruina sp.]
MSRLLLGVAGGIAAYKACSLLRLLTEAGHEVTVVPTASSLNFVGEATWAALSGRPVATDVWTNVHEVPHVRLGQNADLVLIAPATADLIARAAAGRADDLLTNVLLTARCPVVMAPAMHTEMWLHPATVANVATLRSRGVIVLNPADGRLTGADSGPGRLPEPDDIYQVALSVLAEAQIATTLQAQDLAGVRVLISAGGTREHLDPVRYLGNSSSGKMGTALARAAVQRGATVTLVAANLQAEIPAGVTVVTATSTADLALRMREVAQQADVIVMAAAPADYTPSSPSATKLKKDADHGLTINLTQTTDVLAGLVRDRIPGQTIVGFAAETAPTADQLIDLGRAKLARKGCDLLVLNDVSGGRVFGQNTNSIIIIGPDGVLGSVTGDKNVVAHHILNSAIAGQTS